MSRRRELAGQVFGQLTVCERRSGAGSLWLCRCSCGTEVVLPADRFLYGNTKSCGCWRKTFKVGQMVIGSHHGRLTILARGPNRKEYVTWHCLCDCGNEVVVDGAAIRSGNTTSCGCYHREVSKQLKSLPEGIAARNKALWTIKGNAKSREIPWELPDEIAFRLMQQPCVYCGAKDSNRSKSRNGYFLYNGIDRVNNERGYEEENVVSCCQLCNNGKYTLTVTEFLAWIAQVYQHSVVKTA